MAHAGFDCSFFLGTAAMQWLKENSNLEWCGFYLAPAPSHRDMSWMVRRAVMEAQGWGFAPVYVGQQVVGPGERNTNASTGMEDGAEATTLMRTAGFAEGSVVFLDLENGLPLTAPEGDYVRAWVAAVAHGGFTAGVYVSHAMASAVRAVAPAARIWTFNVPTIAPADYHGLTFPAPSPEGSGFAEAVAWQRAQNVNIQVNGRTVKVDLDSAASSDPSKP